MSGYSARVLWVDLNKREISSKDLGEELTKKYIGGGGLAAKILWDDTRAETDPLSPENLLIFMTGPLTGIMRSSSRYIVAGISPLTDIYGEAHSGGDWADELRHTGFDGIVIRGEANKPMYLWLHNEKAKIQDATHLWGKDTYEVEELLRRETDEKASVAAIGPAGEKQVRIACIMNDGIKGRAAARCGLGAVMGAKKLKAIVVRGTLPVKVFDKESFKAYSAKIYALCPIRKWEEIIEGSVDALKGLLGVGGNPIKNWREGDFDAGKLVEDLRVTKPYFCRQCPYSDMESGLTHQGERHTVYEAWAPLGTNCLIANPEALQEAYSFCNRYGMDTISAGGVMGFAMECYEKGLITEKDTGGIKLTWGNDKAMNEILKKIGNKEGFGKILGEGVKRAAEHIGGFASEYAIHVKGLEFPAHDPRAATSFAIRYATGSIGATHEEAAAPIENYVSAPTKNYETESDSLEECREFGFSRKLERFETDGKGKMAAEGQNFGMVQNSLSICSLFHLANAKLRPSHLAELLNYATGWEMDLPEFMRTGERIFNLKRMFNVRRGISRKDDTLPARILAHKRGAGGAAENLPNLGAMLSEYYAYRGWSEEGIPSREKLIELGLNECLG